MSWNSSKYLSSYSCRLVFHKVKTLFHPIRLCLSRIIPFSKEISAFVFPFLSREHEKERENRLRVREASSREIRWTGRIRRKMRNSLRARGTIWIDEKMFLAWQRSIVSSARSCELDFPADCADTGTTEGIKRTSFSRSWKKGPATDRMINGAKSPRRETVSPLIFKAFSRRQKKKWRATLSN